MAMAIGALLTLCLGLLVTAQNVRAEGCPRSFNVSSTVTKFVHCKKLPYLNATLSWTHSKGNGSMDLAFRAKPAASGGWIAWGINPAGTGMVGTQALIAFQQSNGSLHVDTYNVTSKRAALVPSPISINVTQLKAVFYRGQMTIFGTVFLPPGKPLVNQVWQVGSAVKGLNPEVHAFDSANLLSFNTLDVVRSKYVTSGMSPAPSPAPASGGGGAAAPGSASSISKSGACGMMTMISVTVYVYAALVTLLCLVAVDLQHSHLFVV